MFLDWITYVSLTLVVLGWGLLFWRFATFFIGEESSVPFWGELGFYGLFSIGILTTLFNFFSPIHTVIPIAFMIIGIASFTWYFFHDHEIRHTLTKKFVFLSLGISFFFTLFAAYNTFDVNAGLSHLPYQLWLKNEPLVLGLANFHNHFGFDSILDLIFSNFWLPNHNFILVFYLQSFFFFFFYLTLLEFLLRGPDTYRGFSIYFCLLSPLSLLMLDDYVVYGVTNIETPSALAALLSIFSFLRFADGLHIGKNTSADFFSLTVLAAFAMTLSLFAFPILLLVASSYVLQFSHSRINWSLVARLAFFLVLTLLPSVTRHLAITGCFAFPFAWSCFSQLPWSPEEAATLSPFTISALARHPELEFLSHATGWSWVLPWVQRHLEVFYLLGATTIVIFGCGYFHSRFGAQTPGASNTRKGGNLGVLHVVGILLIIFESASLLFWFVAAPDMRLGILPLHMLTLVPALLTVSFVKVKPTSSIQKSYLYFILGIMIIGSCIWKVTDPTKKRFVHLSHIFHISLYVPPVETVPVPPYGVRPLQPEDNECWVAEEPCSPYTRKGRKFDVGRMGPFKAFIPR